MRWDWAGAPMCWGKLRQGASQCPPKVHTTESDILTRLPASKSCFLIKPEAPGGYVASGCRFAYTAGWGAVSCCFLASWIVPLETKPSANLWGSSVSSRLLSGLIPRYVWAAGCRSLPAWLNSASWRQRGSMEVFWLATLFHAALVPQAPASWEQYPKVPRVLESVQGPRLGFSTN